MKFYYVLRKERFGPSIIDNGIVEIPESDLQETLNRHVLWSVVDVVDTAKFANTLAMPSHKTEEGATTISEDTTLSNDSTMLKCPICGFIAKSDFGLKVHRRKHE